MKVYIKLEVERKDLKLIERLIKQKKVLWICSEKKLLKKAGAK